MKNLIARIEALLYIYGEPMDVKKIAGTLEAEADEIKAALKELGNNLQTDDRGLFLVKEKDKFQLTTKPEFSKLLEDVVKEELHESLSPATLETLSIVAYAGPMTRAELEYIRGVNSSFTLRNLLIRGLIARELDPKRGNVFLYAPSLDFLRHVGIAKQENLPEYEKFKVLIDKMRLPVNEEQKPSL